jgi:hypothetical protein
VLVAVSGRAVECFCLSKCAHLQNFLSAVSAFGNMVPYSYTDVCAPQKYFFYLRILCALGKDRIT